MTRNNTRAMLALLALGAAAWCAPRPGLAQAQGKEPGPVVCGTLPAADGYIVLEVDLNGTKRQALFDSTVVYPRHSSRAAGAVEGEARPVVINDGQGARMESRMRTSLNWKAGGVPLPPMQVVEDEMAMIHKLTGTRFDASLGLQPFKGHVVRLDFDRLTLSLGQTPGIGQDGARLPVEWREGLPYVELPFDDRQAKFLIATGSNAVLSLPSALFEELVQGGVVKVMKTPGSGNATTQSMKAARQGRFAKGSLMGVDLAGTWVSETGGSDAMLCLGWLRRFNCEFDLRDGFFSYERRPGFKPPVNWQLMLGSLFAFTEEEPPKVWAVLPESASARAGLRRGDAVLKFGGVEGKALNVGAVAAEVAKAQGRRIHCQIQDAEGKTREADIEIPEWSKMEESLFAP